MPKVVSKAVMDKWATESGVRKFVRGSKYVLFKHYQGVWRVSWSFTGLVQVVDPEEARLTAVGLRAMGFKEEVKTNPTLKSRLKYSSVNRIILSPLETSWDGLRRCSEEACDLAKKEGVPVELASQRKRPPF